MRAGITDEEGIGVVGTLYAALPEDKRPASVQEWLQSENLPRAVTAYLPSTQGALGGNPPPASDPPAPPASPPPSTGAQPAPGAAGVVPGEPGARGGVKLTDLPREEMAQVLSRLRRA